MKNTYTVGQIFRLKLLKNRDGQPYKDKATISKITSKMYRISIKTRWGKGYSIPKSEIDRHNKQWEN